MGMVGKSRVAVSEGGEVGESPASPSSTGLLETSKRAACWRSLIPLLSPPAQCYFLGGGEKLNPLIMLLKIFLQVKVIVTRPL